VIGIYLYATGNQRLARKAIGPSVHVAIRVGPLGRSANLSACCITVAAIVRLVPYPWPPAGLDARNARKSSLTRREGSPVSPDLIDGRSGCPPPSNERATAGKRDPVSRAFPGSIGPHHVTVTCRPPFPRRARDYDWLPRRDGSHRVALRSNGGDVGELDVPWAEKMTALGSSAIMHEFCRLVCRKGKLAAGRPEDSLSRVLTGPHVTTAYIHRESVLKAPIRPLSCAAPTSTRLTPCSCAPPNSAGPNCPQVTLPDKGSVLATQTFSLQ
jgi:hypothetical protein